MTTTVGYAALQIIPTTKGFGSTLGRQVAPQMGTAGSTAGKSFGSGLVASARRFAGPLAIAAGGAAIAKFAKDSITAASDLNESLNAVNVTFGKNAAGIKQLGEEAATAVGLSNNEFNGLAVRFSAFANTVAGRGGDVVGTMDDLTTRAADFASVMNLDVNEAAQLFQSGLAGETEPLRRFGLDLSAARVEAFAFSSGIAKSGQELTEQQKVQARYALLMKQTSKTQGDFANTSGGLANAQRIAAASFENLKAKLGKSLLPVLSSVMSFVAQKLLPAIIRFVPTLKKWGAAFVETAKGIGQAVLPVLKSIISAVISFGQFLIKYQDILLPIAAGIGAIVLALKAYAATQAIIIAVGKAWIAMQIVLNAVLSANPIGLIVLAIVGLVAAFVVAYKKSETFRNIVNAVWASIKTAVTTVINFLKPFIEGAFAFIAKVIGTYVKIWWKVIQVAWAVIKKVITTAVKFIGPVIKGAFKFVVTLAKTYWKIVSTIIKVAWNVIRSIVQTGVNVVVDWFDRIRTVVTVVRTVFAAVVEAIRSRISGVVEFIRGVVGRIVAVFNGLKDKLYEIASNVIGGFVNGIIDNAGKILDAIQTYITDKIPGWIKGPLGIESPSKVTFAIGQFISEGLALGIADGAKEVQEATENLAERAVDAARSVLEKYKSLGQEALSFSRNIASGVREFGQLAVPELEEGARVTGQSVIGDLRTRLQTAQQFGKQLVRLKRLGLNNASLQQIIAAGPFDGSQIAGALLRDGEKAIKTVNSLEKKFGRASAQVGDVGTRSQFGFGTDRAKALASLTLNVNKDAINIKADGDIGPGMERKIRREVNEAFDDIIDRLEART